MGVFYKLWILFAVFYPFKVYSQDNMDKSKFTLGTYGLVYPSRNNVLNVVSGIVGDIHFTKTKRTYLSSSINFQGRYKHNLNDNAFLFTTGVSWRFGRKKWCFQPSWQIGYMYINHNTAGIGSDYIYNSFCGRISCEITYRINQFQVGLLTHLVMGYGQTKEFIYMQPSYRYSFGFIGGIGILLKFSL